MDKISFIIPCYNSENYIGNTVNDLKLVIETELSNYDSEIVLINDGSKDNTFEAIKELAENNKNIIAIDFTRNFGQHSAWEI